MQSILKTAATFLAGAGLAGVAGANEILVTSDITTSTTWTSNNTYNLQQQIYVKNGATLTIEAGTVIASTTDLGGSLAVTQGSRIMVMGTETDPVIMTSKADVATWDPDPTHPTGGDPTTGEWRMEALEWGNLTVMGNAYISEDAEASNTKAPSPSNFAVMEGLDQVAFPVDPDIIYGGGDDEDNSGTIQYLSLRYGGKVKDLGEELNGLSLGGIGRMTDIHHVEIMNNVDDGIEIWGGTVDVKNFSIWNVGDDSFDVDQGWRGRAQFGLIVQGFSLDASQGSGVGDNVFELDGAEEAYYQPVTTAALYNVTVIGQPSAGDHGTAWRDNARVQFRNCIFMDLGEQLVKLDDPGGGGSGYGSNDPGDPMEPATHTWPEVWTTDSSVLADWNPFPMNPGSFYTAQEPGKLAEIKDSVFFRNLLPSAYTEATARGVLDAANDNEVVPGFDDADGPIRLIVRDTPFVTSQNQTLVRVVCLDPRPQNEALTPVSSAPQPDSFWDDAPYRGGFGPNDNWLLGWSASDAFGFVSAPSEVSRNSVANPNPEVLLPGVTSGPAIGKTWDPIIDHTSFLPGATTDLLEIAVSPSELFLPPFGTVLIDAFSFPPIEFTTTPGTPFAVPLPLNCDLVGAQLYAQGISVDPSLFPTIDIRLTNALDITIGIDG